MKKLLFLFVLIVLSAVSMATDRTGAIRPGYTQLSPAMAFTDADGISTSGTVNITISNPQKYLQHQTFTLTLTEVSGSPSIAITAYGKVTSGGSWVQIGTPVTWTGTGSNPAEITSTAPLNYNYLKVALVASGATQHAHIASFAVKTANVYDIGSAAAYVLGVSTGTMAITSSDWAIGATGIATGMGAITSDGLITSTSGLTLGALGSSEVHPALTIIGDADSDAADVDESLVVHLTANTTPTSAVWAFTSTQSAGYTFDKAVSVTGPINQAIAGGTVVTSAGLLGGGGTSTSATQTLGSAGGKAFSYYLSSTSSTASHVLTGYYMNVNYGATGGAGAAPSGDVIRGRAYLMGDASGTTALTGGAFSVELEASTASNTGLTAGMRGNLVLPDGVLTNAGTYYGTMAEVFLGGAATDTRAYTSVSPLGIVVSGTPATAAAQLSNMAAIAFNVPANMVTSDGTMIVTGGAGDTCDAKIRITINGTPYWIMLSTDDE